MSIAIHLRPAEGPAACALCRSPVRARPVTCPACRVGYHRDCLVELASRCATVGCAGLTRTVRSLRSRQLEAPGWVLLLPLALLGLLIVAGALAPLVPSSSTLVAVVGVTLSCVVATAACVGVAWAVTPAPGAASESQERPGAGAFVATVLFSSGMGFVVHIAASQDPVLRSLTVGTLAGAAVGVPLGMIAWWFVALCAPPPRRGRRR